MGEILRKLTMNNVMVAKFRAPQKPSSLKEMEIAINWNILPNFQNFDNSKLLARKRIRWIPPTMSTVKLNFDGAMRDGMAVACGVL